MSFLTRSEAKAEAVDEEVVPFADEVEEEEQEPR
ncbi:Butyryl-CoA dehydrogenase [Corchorus olitorius]|uniref:Butyryl-CoA dehydrogenase n=1 Tax=Corchorus olitorius TaxID=93759 RepID=A0A1R3I4F4_9ROSI|nr:Butyryl-CoA dehydrogenase [Corchorus olitorius]